jgi:toxin ParE1/3/4
MVRIELASEVLGDFDRFFDHLARFNAVDEAPERIKEIIEAVDILAHSPLIVRKVKGGLRELVIGRASRGYVALYRFLPDIDTVFVLAFRSQREAGYKRRR